MTAIINPAVFAEYRPAEDSTSEETDVSMAAGDLSLEQLQTRTLPQSDRPEAVSMAEVSEMGHVNRLRAQEADLSTVMFQNIDGTKTMYIFDSPVKYVDKSGIIRDKSSKIAESAYIKYKWQNAANDIHTLFPASLSAMSGVVLNYSGEDAEVNVELIPATRGSALSAGISDGDSVTYQNVFGPSTALRYTPKLNGFKEEIILSQNTGINTFGFTLKTGGLRLTGDNELGWSLNDPFTGEKVVYIGRILVYDNNNAQTVGSLTANVISPDSEYYLTISVDEDFLSSADTVYPVVIDPDLTFSPRNSANHIHDAAIYTNKPNTNVSNGYQHIGYVNSNYGVGRVLVKFPNLMSNATFAGLQASQITAASLRMYREPGFGGPATIGINSYTGPVWTETTVGYTSSIWNGVGFPVGTAYVSDVSYFDFDILTAVKAWKNGTSGFDPAKGLIFKNNSSESSSSYDRSFYATEGAGATLPLLTITYNTYVSPSGENPNIVSGDVYYIENAARTGIVLGTYNLGTANGTRIWQTAYSGSTSQRFKLEYVSNYGYKIIPQNTTGKVLTVNSQSQLVIDTFSSGNLKHYWNITTNSDGTFTLTNRSTTYKISTISGATNLYVDTSQNGNCQKWRINKYVSLPPLFRSLVSSSPSDLYKIKYTDDGFFIFVKSLADILSAKGVTYITTDTNDNQPVYSYYDDWYIFSVNKNNSWAYGLAKMRETENDHPNDESMTDTDEPGAAISFIGFESGPLISCLASNTLTNRQNLYNSIDKVIGVNRIVNDKLKYNQIILDYFKNPASKGSYLVAEEFVNKIAAQKINGFVDAPPPYIELKDNYIEGFNLYKSLLLQSGYNLSDEEIRQYYFNDANTKYDIKFGYRVYQRTLDLNKLSGRNIYDFSNERINLGTSNNLSLYQKQMILVTHTANATFNSFAAEVKFHADYAEQYFGDWGWPNIYRSAIVADMSIDEGTGSRTEISDEYYDLNSSIVQEQITHHGEY